MNIHQSTSAYEDWLRTQLRGEAVEKDLKKKHEKMRDSAFVFLRATYWRWAERIPVQCQELNGAPSVLAIGDIHVENFGTWRDEDGRLVWGVNDFDEAAPMPYAFDLVRLAVSAYLGQQGKDRGNLSSICDSVLMGYLAGLQAPEPFILDKDHTRMRQKFVASEADREKFWKKMVPKGDSTLLPPRFNASLDDALPADAEPAGYWPRSAGVGSLGRPRWVALAHWKGGPVVREAKAVVPSGWCYAHKHDNPSIRITEIANGHYRASDPWFQLNKQNVVVRRLSPNNHKIEMDNLGEWLFENRFLEHMGREVASIHLGTEDLGREIRADIAARPSKWLTKAAERAARSTEDDFEAWCKGKSTSASD